MLIIYSWLWHLPKRYLLYRPYGTGSGQAFGW